MIRLRNIGASVLIGMALSGCMSIPEDAILIQARVTTNRPPRTAYCECGRHNMIVSETDLLILAPPPFADHTITLDHDGALGVSSPWQHAGVVYEFRISQERLRSSRSFSTNSGSWTGLSSRDIFDGPRPSEQTNEERPTRE